MNLMELTIIGLASGYAGMLFKRKNGIGGIFRALRQLPVVRQAFKCEPCTVFWFSVAGYCVWGIVPILRPGFYLLASCAVAQAVASFNLFAVVEDPE